MRRLSCGRKPALSCTTLPAFAFTVTGQLFRAFTSGELSFAEMREARVADLVEVFSLKAVDDLIRRFEDAYAPAFFANVRLFDDVLPLVEAAKLTREDWLSSGAGEGVRITGSEACRPYFGV